ncbi:MAG: hypothetical protein AAB019_12335 [Planctomycetota bacterium]
MNQNLNETEFKQYLETYDKTLKETAIKFLPQDAISKLWAFAIQPSHVVGYLSTNFGIGYEYVQGKGDIQIIRGSLRIEDLFLKTTKQIQGIKSRGVVASGSGVIILDSCQFKDTYPFSLESTTARIRIANTTFEASNWKRYIALGEVLGNRKKEFWTTELAIVRAKDEILIALTDISQTKKYQVSFDEFIKQHKPKTVLILGDYSREPRLREIERILGKMYNPILAKDIPDNLQQDLRQKVVTIGAVSRFVVVEDSTASGHISELGDCKNNDWVTIILREQGQQSTFMTAGISSTSTVMKEYEYTAGHLQEVLTDAVKWAEQTISTRTERMIIQYPWRIL